MLRVVQTAVDALDQLTRVVNAPEALPHVVVQRGQLRDRTAIFAQGHVGRVPWRQTVRRLAQVGRLVSILVRVVPFLVAALTGCPTTTALVWGVALIYLDAATGNYSCARWRLIS